MYYIIKSIVIHWRNVLLYKSSCIYFFTAPSASLYSLSLPTTPAISPISPNEEPKEKPPPLPQKQAYADYTNLTDDLPFSSATLRKNSLSLSLRTKNKVGYVFNICTFENLVGWVHIGHVFLYLYSEDEKGVFCDLENIILRNFFWGYYFFGKNSLIITLGEGDIQIFLGQYKTLSFAILLKKSTIKLPIFLNQRWNLIPV